MNPIIDSDGNKYWRNKKGRYHRKDGPALEYIDGSKEWCINGEYHREDGPAVEWDDGSKEWWINGKLHRLDGPAIQWIDGTTGWYYHGKFIDCDSQEEFEKLIKLRMFW